MKTRENHQLGAKQMAYSANSPDLAPLEKHAPRSPCVTVASALAIGIVLDRYLRLDPSMLHGALLALLCCWLLSIACRVSLRVITTCIVTGLLVLGALWHHQQWFDRASNDIENLLTHERRLLKVRGRTVGFTTRIVREDCFEAGRLAPPLTRFNVEVSDVMTVTGWVPHSGVIRVDVEGPFELAPGDSVEVFGWAQKFRGPANPGEPDYRIGQQAQRVRGTLRPANTKLIKVDVERRSWLSAGRHWLRKKCDEALREQLDGDSLAAALAFLLGDRSLLSSEVRNAFIETGTMHVLAISGVHVTVLAMFVAGICRVLGGRGRFVVLVVLLVSAAYLAIADVRPPMTRAFVLIVVWAAEQWLVKRAISFNSLALAAIVILYLNPTDLFDVGAQLSFLAVATMIWWARLERRWLPGLFPSFRSELPMHWLERFARRNWARLWRLGVRSLLLSIVIWLVTVPLVAATFHVVSPIGPMVNVPLAVVASPALWVGFLFVIAAPISTSLAGGLGVTLDWLLTAMLGIVRWAASVPYGHVYVPAPPEWWLHGIYAAIGALMLLWLYRLSGRVCLAGVVAWSLFGASLALRPEPHEGLRCTFLSVGHGCAVVIETPEGRVLAYDIGCKTAADFAKRVVSQALWQRRHRGVDALVLSHADADHFNGVRGLLKSTPVARVYASPAFLATQQRGAFDALSAVRERGLPLQPLTSGDAIVLEPGIEFRVLHPHESANYESDNAGSVVLELKYAGRTILLTGDLEGSGLQSLLQQPARQVDVLMAPHHGSLNDNPVELMRWASPRWVVASAGRTVSLARLQERYGTDSRVMATSIDGAIEFEISPSGNIRVQTYGTEDDE